MCKRKEYDIRTYTKRPRFFYVLIVWHDENGASVGVNGTSVGATGEGVGATGAPVVSTGAEDGSTGAAVGATGDDVGDFVGDPVCGKLSEASTRSLQ